MRLRAKKRTAPSPFVATLRYLFAKSDDPYAGADLGRAKALGAFEWFAGAVVVVVLMPLSPPTAAIGAAGWAVAAAVIMLSLAACARLRRAPERVGVNELLAMSYVAVISIGVLEWLAGGHHSPYHQLYLLSVVYTATVHPGRRVLPYFATFLVVVSASLVYAPTSASDIGDVFLQAAVCLAMALMGLVVMAGVRVQRLAMTAKSEADRELALTDDLTGLANRRRLVADLETAAAEATGESPTVLALFDLDGFKAYNDTFGHPAGDALLQRLAGALREAAAGSGRAYRMGGDEFCVLARPGERSIPALVMDWRAALCEDGEGFSVVASTGWVVLPHETTDPNEALRAADRRMYATKGVSRADALSAAAVAAG